VSASIVLYQSLNLIGGVDECRARCAARADLITNDQINSLVL